MPTLKEVRITRGVKQKAIAEHLGLSRATYSKYENNQSTMSIEQARAVCKFLHCSMEDIFLAEDVN